MYSKRFIMHVFDEHKRSLSGENNAEIINVPFGTEYKIFLKNDNDFDCAVDIKVDGVRPLGFENGKPNFLILPSHQKYLLEGWFNKNLRGGDRFKLVSLDSPEAKLSSRVKNDSDNGIIEATFYPASKLDPYVSLREDWERRLKNHEKLRREYNNLQDEIERLRLLQKIRELEEEIERHKRHDKWVPWIDRWEPRYPKYKPIPIWIYQPNTTTDNFEYQGLSQLKNIRYDDTNSLNEDPYRYKDYTTCSTQPTSTEPAEKSISPNNSKSSGNSLGTCGALLNVYRNSKSLYFATIDKSDVQDAVTERGSCHYDSLSKVDYEVGDKPLTKLQIRLMGFHAPYVPVITPKSKSDVSDPTPTNARFCTKCGHKLGNHNFRFCPMCGNVISK